MRLGSRSHSSRLNIGEPPVYLPEKFLSVRCIIINKEVSELDWKQYDPKSKSLGERIIELAKKNKKVWIVIPSNCDLQKISANPEEVLRIYENHDEFMKMIKLKPETNYIEYDISEISEKSEPDQIKSQILAKINRKLVDTGLSRK